MSAFTLDTSGKITFSHPKYGGRYTWTDLDPFTQGYVEALFASLATPPFTDHPHLKIPLSFGEQIVGFSDLSPSALERIMRDCGSFLKGCEGTRVWGFASDGRLFWEGRQRGHMPANFPPLEAYLDADGRVNLRERA